MSKKYFCTINKETNNFDDTNGVKWDQGVFSPPNVGKSNQSFMVVYNKNSNNTFLKVYRWDRNDGKWYSNMPFPQNHPSSTIANKYNLQALLPVIKNLSIADIEKETLVAEKEALVAEKETLAAEKETAIIDKEDAIIEKDVAVAEKETAVIEMETSRPIGSSFHRMLVN